MSKLPKKQRLPKRLAVSDLEQSKTAVLTSISNGSQRFGAQLNDPSDGRCCGNPSRRVNHTCRQHLIWLPAPPNPYTAAECKPQGS
jgi:hypothetical protein